MITFNLMYPEQPSIYLANQTIHHLSDLLNIYLHPQLLNKNIPFFRPSGHFLIYQIITPFLGWHNTKAFFVINFIFLGLIGFFMIELYHLLFPPHKIGGYVAFSIYLMHPALSLSRITIMHFEFAYVLFLLISLYLFVIFCQKNHPSHSPPNQSIAIEIRKLHSFPLFALSLFIFILAVTFKEPAVMLGPVLMCYFWIYFYNKEPWLNYYSGMMKNYQSLCIMIPITLLSILLGLYIIASWPSLQYPTSIFTIGRTISAINNFFKDVCGFTSDLFHLEFIPPDLAWRTIIFPDSARFMIGIFLILALISTTLTFILQSANQFIYKKSLIFLYLSSTLFLILPLTWATAGPWHYALTLIGLSLIMGFSLESLCSLVITHQYFVYSTCLLISLINLFLTTNVNHVNIKKYDEVDNGKLGLTLNRNAVLNPPDIKNKLTPESVIVVEDSHIHNDYLMGNAAYPFLLFLAIGEYDYLMQRQAPFFLKFHPVYGSNLFRYAYLMPSLKEELYPFNVENMDDISNEVIYNWLTHYNNIFCLGYDALGNWHDKTLLFKKQLLKIKSERNLSIHPYSTQSVTLKNNHQGYTEILTYPDAKLCQYKCDQDNTCVGFVYENSSQHNHSVMQCYYSTSTYSPGAEMCAHCTWFKKLKVLKSRPQAAKFFRKN